jgi:hypothetical protein
MPSSHSADTLVVGFDDAHAVANAGLVLPATLAECLGVEAAVDELSTLPTGRATTGPDARCSPWCTR